MPTGYTAGVADGSITTLEQFALTCARGMGALIMMRDDPMDAPISEKFEPSDYNAKRLKEANDRLTELRVMTPEQIRDGAATWNEENEAYKQKRVRENLERRERYDALISETETWEGAPNGLKEFMLQQLRDSREFDTSDDPLEYCEKEKSPEEWFAGELKSAERDIEYHSKANADESKRTEERNAWIRQLRESLNLAKT